MHWTYTQADSDSDLQQGDFLAPTDKLQDVLREVHPHFCADKYIAFVVTTQTCDLVRRGKKPPKAQYINIAAVRPLIDTSAKLFQEIIPPITKGIFRKSDKAKAKDFLQRLFNQNEQALGLFYFHPDADIGLGSPSVAFLRIIIALHAEKHYDELLAARTGRLDPVFQAKLGWLVGNLYSRAATPDWADQSGGQKALDQLKEDYLSERLPGHGPNWVEDELLIAGQAKKVDFDERDASELIKELEQYRPPPSIEKLVNEVANQARSALTPHAHIMEQVSEAFQKTEKQILMLQKEETKSGVEEAGSEIHQHGLLAQVEIQNAIKQAIYELKVTALDLLSTDEAKIKKFSNRLANNGKIKKLLK